MARRAGTGLRGCMLLAALLLPGGAAAGTLAASVSTDSRMNETSRHPPSTT